jgi:hypothetical protein
MQLPNKLTYSVWIVALILISGCGTGVPVEPTLAVLPTLAPTFEPSPVSTTIAPTLPATWTPKPPPTAIPVTVIVAPGPAELTEQAPMGVIKTSDKTLTVTLSEAQLNVAIMDRYNVAPLANYPDAPLITLDDGGLIITAHIIPQTANAGSQPQTISLLATFNIFEGALELQPTELSPQNVGVTTKQVKLAHNLLMRTISEMVLQAAGAPGYTYDFAVIAPDKLTFTIALNTQ